MRGFEPEARQQDSWGCESGSRLGSICCGPCGGMYDEGCQVGHNTLAHGVAQWSVDGSAPKRTPRKNGVVVVYT